MLKSTLLILWLLPLVWLSVAFAAPGIGSSIDSNIAPTRDSQPPASENSPSLPPISTITARLVASHGLSNAQKGDYPRGFKRPGALALSPDEKRLLVADTANNQLQLLSSTTLKPLLHIDHPAMQAPAHLSWQGSLLWVAEAYRPRIHLFEMQALRPLYRQSYPLDNLRIQAMTGDVEGNLYIADARQRRLLKVNLLLEQAMELPLAISQVSAMAFIDQQLWISDRQQRQLIRATHNGEPRQRYTAPQAPLKVPAQVALYNQHIFISDAGRHQIQVFQQSGQLQGVVNIPGLSLHAPRGVALSSNHLFVSDTGNNRLIKLALPQLNP